MAEPGESQGPGPLHFFLGGAGALTFKFRNLPK